MSSYGSAAISVGSSISKGILNATNAYVSAKQAESLAKYERGVIEANETVVQAIYRFQVRRQKEQGKRFLSRQRALYGKSGVKLEGSPLEVMAHSAKEIELDIFATQFDAKTSQFRADTQIAEKNLAMSNARSGMVLGMVSAAMGATADSASAIADYKASQKSSGQTLTTKDS